VLVTIEEPHMYNADDAIARVDSYIVSVSGAAPHVGKRKLVRIESVERSAALASLIDGAGENGGSGDGGSGDGSTDEVKSSSSRRRRGRRGGRRRSRAGSGSGGSSGSGGAGKAESS
jgi:ribonuclease G